jgi:hypothetical protein
MIARAARGLSQMDIVVAVMRKLLHFAFGVLKSPRPFEPDLNLSSPAAAAFRAVSTYRKRREFANHVNLKCTR